MFDECRNLHDFSFADRNFAEKLTFNGRIQSARSARVNEFKWSISTIVTTVFTWLFVKRPSKKTTIKIKNLFHIDFFFLKILNDVLLVSYSPSSICEDDVLSSALIDERSTQRKFFHSPEALFVRLTLKRSCRWKKPIWSFWQETTKWNRCSYKSNVFFFVSQLIIQHLNPTERCQISLSKISNHQQAVLLHNKVQSKKVSIQSVWVNPKPVRRTFVFWISKKKRQGVSFRLFTSFAFNHDGPTTRRTFGYRQWVSKINNFFICFSSDRILADRRVRHQGKICRTTSKTHRQSGKIVHKNLFNSSFFSFRLSPSIDNSRTFQRHCESTNITQCSNSKRFVVELAVNRIGKNSNYRSTTRTFSSSNTKRKSNCFALSSLCSEFDLRISDDFGKSIEEKTKRKFSIFV